MYLLHWMEDKTPPLTSNHHHGHGENFLSICRRGNVSKADARQAGHGEVQGSDVDGVFVGPALPLPWTAGIEAVRRGVKWAKLKGVRVCVCVCVCVCVTALG